MKQSTPHISTVITAAGESTRMGQPKALLRWGGGTFLEAMIRALEAADFPLPPAVVIGADRERILNEVSRLGAVPLLNPNYRAGRFTSIRLAAQWVYEKAAHTGIHNALLLWPIDCPGVTATTLSQLHKDAMTQPRCNIVPIFEGRAGHPVILCETFLETILETGVNGNLRELLRYDQTARRACPVDDPAVLDNLNGPDDYERFLRSRPAPQEVAASDGEEQRASQS